MPILFQGNAGKVVQFNDPAAQCTTSRYPLGMDKSVTPLTWSNYRAIITRVTVSQQVNLQFLHTMGSLIYVYVFGDRMGTVNLSGLSFFLCECDTGCPNDQLPNLVQPDVFSWYRVNRASRRPKPLKISIGDAVLTGFVTGFSEDVVDPSLNLFQWNIGMAAIADEG